MTTPELQPAEPNRRPFQFSLRSLFGLTTGTAAFFALGRTLGYADTVVVLAAIVVLVAVMEFPRRVHLVTGILLSLAAGTLLWANLRTNGWQKEFNIGAPVELDPVARSMFCRGWPLSPFMICPCHGMTFDPNEGAVHLALSIDSVVFVVALFVLRVICELCFRRRVMPAINTPPAGSTSVPPVE